MFITDLSMIIQEVDEGVGEEGEEEVAEEEEFVAVNRQEGVSVAMLFETMKKGSQ